MAKLSIICDENDIVRDIASARINLSRGLGIQNHKLYEDVEVEDVQIGDVYKNDALIRNQDIRNEQQQNATNERKIQMKMRAIAIEQLKSTGELPADYK